MQIKRKILPVLAAAMLFCLMFTGMAFAEPVNGAQSQNPQIQAGGTILMVVDSNTGRVKANYRLEDFYNLGFDNTFPLDNSNKDPLVFQKFSGTSGVYYTAWYGVVGVTLEYLLRDLGIWDTFTEVTFISEDSTYAYLKADDIKKGQKYYYEDSDKEIATVYPMIGFWYTESAVNVFTYPVEPAIIATYMHENAPGLFYGQGSYLEDGNRGEFVKNISTIYVDFPPDDQMTRAMFVTVIGRLAGVDASQYQTADFTDVQAGTWYAPYCCPGSGKRYCQRYQRSGI